MVLFIYSASLEEYDNKTFLANLAILYAKWNKDKKVVEVVIFSGDEDEKGYQSTMGTDPWVFILYNDLENRRDNIGDYVQFTDYPTLVVVNVKTGEVF